MEMGELCRLRCTKGNGFGGHKVRVNVFGQRVMWNRTGKFCSTRSRSSPGGGGSTKGRGSLCVIWDCIEIIGRTATKNGGIR